MKITATTVRTPRVAVLGAIGVAVATLLIAAIVGFHLGGRQFTVAVDDLGQTLAALAAAAACAWAARGAVGPYRRGWWLMFASTITWSLGQVVWSIYEVGLGVAVPFSSLPYLAFFVSLPLAILAVLTFWTSPTETSRRWRVWFDGLIVFGALTFAFWAFGLKAVYLDSGFTALERVSSVAYPLVEIAMLTVLVLTLRRAPQAMRDPVLLLLGGLALRTVADLSFIIETPGGVPSHWLDVGWVVCFLLIAGAAFLWPSRPETVPAPDNELSIGLWQVALPWTAVLVAAASAVTLVVRGGAADQFLTLLAAMLASLLMVNQVLARADAHALLVKGRESELLLSEMVAHARRGIVRTDKDFKIVGTNPGLGDLFGLKSEAMLGSHIAKYVSVEARQEVREKLDRLMRGEIETLDIHVQGTHSDGHSLWLGASIYAVKDTLGRVDYALTYIEDLTAKHEAELAAKSSLGVLEHLNQVRTEFIRSVSHEFKTGLVGIQGFSELIADAKEIGADEAKTYAKDIYASASRLDGLVTELVQLNEVELAPIKLCLESLDLNEVAGAEVEKNRPRMANVLLTMNRTPSMPTLLGDVARLSEVVHTLLVNALKYSPPGGEIMVSTGVSLGEAMVSVSDQGVGARIDFDNQVFEGHDIYADSPIRKVVGTGLGLGIARQIVEMHGGHIWVERMPTGSEFHFTIPLPLADVTSARQPTVPARGKVA